VLLLQQASISLGVKRGCPVHSLALFFLPFPSLVLEEIDIVVAGPDGA
jgi:hypothetical protein